MKINNKNSCLSYLSFIKMRCHLLVNSRKASMDSLKENLLLLRNFKGLQRLGAEFSKHSTGISEAALQKKNVFHYLCSIQKILSPAIRLYFNKADTLNHLFFTCYMKLSFSLLRREAHHNCMCKHCRYLHIDYIYTCRHPHVL